ncbi:C-terminal binding protein [Oribacterium sp. WCC10]|uniref:C-terminal binding protein n=1 Tax=Oribacterium sp. WCC10 TaxID=1855343 RepID=UPI0008F0DEE2|nr:C-terminal binding protein [Oribacterium sp. WCC10]SFG74977.1 D-3-phosphoglycerate dehydrogenase [Oribacterium sp. WCC10]
MSKIVLFLLKNTRGGDEMTRRIESLGIQAEVVYDADPEETIASCRGADAVLTVLTPFTREIISSLDTTVRAIIVAAMGFDHIDVTAAKERGIDVYNVPDYAVQEVAVHQISLMLASLRKLNIYDRFMHEGNWRSPDYIIGAPVHRLSTLTYGLLGFGRISREVAKYAIAFGMRVIAYDPFVEKIDIEKSGVVCADDRNEVFRCSDIISPNVPLSDSSRYLIDENAILHMKDGVIIVNTGRGALIHEQALIKGLQSGKVSAAALDVFEKEPFFDKTSPLMNMDNVILTPHIAYHSDESEKEVMMRAVDGAIAVTRVEKPLGISKVTK